LRYALLLVPIVCLALFAQSCPSDGTGLSCGSCGSREAWGSERVISRTGTTRVVPEGAGLFITAVIEYEDTSLVSVHYSLVESSDVSLWLTDVSGEPLRLITDGYHEFGNHMATFPAEDLSPGMYTIRLDAMEATAYCRIFLLR